VLDKKQHTNEYMKSLTTLEQLAKYPDQLHIYVDGSRNDGRTACAFIAGRIESIHRLEDQCDIMEAELTAISKAIKHITVVNKESTPCLICLDSLRAVNEITKDSNKNHHELINTILKDIADAKSVQLTILWIPSHVGITGHDRANAAAKSGLSLADSCIAKNGPTENNCFNYIKQLAITEWQKLYDANPQLAIHYKIIQPTVDTKIKLIGVSRRHESLKMRLRSGHCLVDKTVHRYNKNTSPTCQQCGKSKTFDTS